MAKNSSPSRAPKNWRSTPGQPEEREKMAQNASKKPIIATITQLQKLRTQNCCTTGMSTEAGDELNLRHFHCLQTTVIDNNGHVNDHVQKLDDPDEPAQRGHHPPCLSTATAEPSQ